MRLSERSRTTPMHRAGMGARRGGRTRGRAVDRHPSSRRAWCQSSPARGGFHRPRGQGPRHAPSGRSAPRHAAHLAGGRRSHPVAPARWPAGRSGESRSARRRSLTTTAGAVDARSVADSRIADRAEQLAEDAGRASRATYARKRSSASRPLPDHDEAGPAADRPYHRTARPRATRDTRGMGQGPVRADRRRRRRATRRGPVELPSDQDVDPWNQ